MLPVGVFLRFEMLMVCQNHVATYQQKLFLNNLPADNSTRSSFPLAETKELESSHFASSLFPLAPRHVLRPREARPAAPGQADSAHPAWSHHAVLAKEESVSGWAVNFSTSGKESGTMPPRESPFAPRACSAQGEDHGTAECLSFHICKTRSGSCPEMPPVLRCCRTHRRPQQTPRPAAPGSAWPPA